MKYKKAVTETSRVVVEIEAATLREVLDLPAEYTLVKVEHFSMVRPIVVQFTFVREVHS